VVFFIDRTREEFLKKKDLTKPRKSQTVTLELAINHQFSWRIYRRYIVKLTSVVFFLKIEVNLHSKSTRFLYCYFWLRGKLVENTSLSQLIISPRSLHNLWNFPRYANYRCTGHATMSTERGNDQLITAHAPSCHTDHRPLSQKFLRIPPQFFVSVAYPKKINPHNLQLSTSHCGPSYERRTEVYSAIASKKVRAM